jgi:hypothetical protein
VKHVAGLCVLVELFTAHYIAGPEDDKETVSRIVWVFVMPTVLLVFGAGLS